MEEQAAVVQVDGANSGETVINYEILCMDKAGGILVYLYPRLQQGGIVSPGDLEDIPLVGDVRSNDAYIHSRFGGIA